jgi:transposase
VDRKIVEALLGGKAVNAITRDLKVGKERVRGVRERACEAGYLDGSRPLPPFPEALFPDPVDGRTLRTSDQDKTLATHRPWIEDRLQVGWHAITIFEELPVKVSRSSFYRFLARHELHPRRHRQLAAVPEIVHKPGEALLVDWGKLYDYVDVATGARKTIWAFVGVLGYSRFMTVRLVVRCDLETTLAALEDMLREIGGVPQKLTSDNPKVFALEASRHETLVHPVYERFAAYYGTTVECLPPAAPQLKGKVERPMPYLRRLFEAYGGNLADVAAAQDYLAKKVALANERRHGTTGERPIERLIEREAAALRELPKLPWSREEYHEGKVRKDSHVRFRGKYYSVDPKLVGEEVRVIASATRVFIYHADRLVETHDRVRDAMLSKSTKPEHLAPWVRAMNDTSVYRDRARQLGPHVDIFVAKLIGSGLGVIDFRRVWGLLSLDKVHAPQAIDDACRQALEIGSQRLRTVKTFLDLAPKAGSAAPAGAEWPVSPAPGGAADRVNRFVRNMQEYAAAVAASHVQ